MRAFTNNLFICYSIAIMSHDRNWSENFEKTKTLHLSKVKNIFLKISKKISSILWFTFRIERKVSYLYMKRVLFSFEFLSWATMFRVNLLKKHYIPGIIDTQIKTRDSFTKAKICKKWLFKVFDKWIKSCFSKFFSVMSDVSLIR